MLLLKNIKWRGSFESPNTSPRTGKPGTPLKRTCAAKRPAAAVEVDQPRTELRLTRPRFVQRNVNSVECHVSYLKNTNNSNANTSTSNNANINTNTNKNNDTVYNNKAYNTNYNKYKTNINKKI